MSMEPDRCPFLLADTQPLGEVPLEYRCVDTKARACSGRSNDRDPKIQAGQRQSRPCLTDLGEEPVLDGVPFRAPVG